MVCGSDLNSGFEDGGEDMPKEQAIWYLEPYNENTSGSSEEDILIEDKSHYLSVLAPQIGATGMQRALHDQSKLENDSISSPSQNVGLHDFSWLIQFWNLNYNPPQKLRNFSKWPRFGVPRIPRSGNLSLEKVMTEFMFPVDSTPTVLRQLSLDENDPAKELTFKMTKLKFEMCYSRGKQRNTFDSKRDILDLAYQGLDLHMPKVFLNKDDCTSVIKVAQITRKSSKSSSADRVEYAKGITERHRDDGFLLSSDYFTIRRQSPKADPARLLAWQEAGRKNLEMAYVGQSLKMEVRVMNRQGRTQVRMMALMGIMWCKFIYTKGRIRIRPISNEFKQSQTFSAIDKHGFDDSEEEGTRRFMVNVIEPQFNLHSDDANLNDLRDQVEQTRLLNVVFRSATALGSRLPSMANARAKVAGSEPQDDGLDSRDHWKRVMQGHAGANLVPLVASNRIGKEVIETEHGKSAITFYGNSFIAVMKRAQNVAQVVVKTRSTLSAWSCMGARRPVGNALTDDFSETSLILEKHADSYIRQQATINNPKVLNGGDTELLMDIRWLMVAVLILIVVLKTLKWRRHRAFDGHTMVDGCGSDLNSGFEDGGRNILRICLKSRLFGILNHIMKAHQVLLRKILILIEDKSHYLSVLAPQIGATWMQRGIFMTRDDIRKFCLFIDASGDSYSDKEGNLWMITGGRSTLKAAKIRIMEKEKNKSPSCVMPISLQIKKVAEINDMVLPQLLSTPAIQPSLAYHQFYSCPHFVAHIHIYASIVILSSCDPWITLRMIRPRSQSWATLEAGGISCLMVAYVFSLLTFWLFLGVNLRHVCLSSKPTIVVSLGGRICYNMVEFIDLHTFSASIITTRIHVYIYPLKIHLTERMYRTMWEYFFPEEEQDSQRRQVRRLSIIDLSNFWKTLTIEHCLLINRKFGTTSGLRRAKKGSIVNEASASSSHSTKESEGSSRSNPYVVPVTSGSNHSSSMHSSSFDRKCEESVAESVADELVLQLHSSNFAPSKMVYKDTKTSKTGRSSQEEKKINKPNDEKRSRPRVMREFHHIKISQVELLVTYKGSRFAGKKFRGNLRGQGKETTVSGIPTTDLNLSDRDQQPGLNDHLRVQRRRAKAIVLRTMRGDGENDHMAGHWSESDSESPFARQLTITKTRKLIRRHTKKFRAKKAPHYTFDRYFDAKDRESDVLTLYDLLRQKIRCCKTPVRGYFQVADFRNSIIMIISDKSPSDEDVVNTFKMLASAAYYQITLCANCSNVQPAFLVAIVDLKDSTTDFSLGSLGPKGENLLDALLLGCILENLLN
ncbi:golgi-body localization protein domain-containing protein [Artemisia annua]|uniref:Golgi-body localization protein domain-containing protein n=1 Tax=Artemisia annua TaxID=35608 RepID=A0A2U1Q047_ARTAN|nr:golgi-body localization protein domain-containing protein [Artemisia annua]